MRNNLRLTLLSLSVSLALAACGGGGGGDTTTPGNTSGSSTNNGSNNGNTSGTNTGSNTGDTSGSVATGPAAVPATFSMAMSCIDGSTAQCSGGDIIRIDNGIALTNSGVQVYGKSTKDDTIPPGGLALASGGTTEIRLMKDTSGIVSIPQLLLSNFGIMWDGVHERPPIAEIFLTTKKRIEVTKDTQGRYVLSQVDLPGAAFFDSKTPEHYANNNYFDAAPCQPGTTCGVQTTANGNWQPAPAGAGGTDPTVTSAGRLHDDGDMKAPNPTSPGSKGFRSLLNFSYHYANLSKWESQDTVDIDEWEKANGTPPVGEHNLNRHGIVTFGDVTAPTTVPSTGKATYHGWIYGYYAEKTDIPGEPDSFKAAVTVSVDFATRAVTITVDKDSAINETKTTPTTRAPLPAVEFSTTVPMGAVSTNVANYLNGTVANGNLKGGIGGRLFGPVGTAGVPPEIGGSFSMSDATSGATFIGGLIAINR